MDFYYVFPFREKEGFAMLRLFCMFRCRTHPYQNTP